MHVNISVQKDLRDKLYLDVRQKDAHCSYIKCLPVMLQVADYLMISYTTKIP